MEQLVYKSKKRKENLFINKTATSGNTFNPEPPAQPPELQLKTPICCQQTVVIIQQVPS
jgi:hypothetical protein